MSVNNISCIGCYVSTNSRLKEETRRKLLALGLDPSTVTSETEAQTLIKNAQQKQEIQKTENQSNSKNTCTGEEDIKRTAENETAVYNMLNMNANINKFILGL